MLINVNSLTNKRPRNRSVSLSLSLSLSVSITEPLLVVDFRCSFAYLSPIFVFCVNSFSISCISYWCIEVVFVIRFKIHFKWISCNYARTFVANNQPKWCSHSFVCLFAFVFVYCGLLFIFVFHRNQRPPFDCFDMIVAIAEKQNTLRYLIPLKSKRWWRRRRWNETKIWLN